ncbi:MAG TPA: hypothetical protein VGD14_19775 [bacterium]
MGRVSFDRKDEILKILEKKIAPEEINKSPILLEFLILGFEQKLRELYDVFQRGESSLGYLADQLGISSWEAVDLLEKRGLRTTNL